MLGCIRGAALALGLIVALPGALTQERVEPALEGEPGSDREQQEPTEAGDQNPTPEQENPRDFLPAIHGIEAAIRDLISEEDDAARERTEQRENADLKAQEQMARWTLLMGIAAFLSVFLAAVGILLIWRTLKHTAITADAAIAASEEARKSTDAAARAVEATIAGNIINRQTFIESKRAWIACSLNDCRIMSPLIWNEKEGSIVIGTKIRNIGETPAIDVFSLVKIVPWKRRGESATKLAKSLREGIAELKLGITIFPNEEIINNNQINIPVDCLNKGGRISPVFIKCIDYGIAFSGERRRTIVMFEIQRLPDANGNVAIGPAYGSIPRNQLHFYVGALRSTVAD